MKTLAVVRYKYSAAQALTEILRSEFDSSDEESNSNCCDLDVDIDEDAVKNTLTRSE